MTATVHVAAGALIDDRGRVLLARRHDHAHQGGLWEFPGGKCEAGETPQAALVRELREELGIEVAACRPLIRVAHDYGDRRVVLHVFRVEAWEGEPHGLEDQPLEWVVPAALVDYPMPAADRPVVTALRLPDTCLITRPEGDEPESVLAHLERGLAAGVRLVQFRVFGVGEEGRWRLFEQVRARCREADALLLCNSAMGIDGAEADGLHLSARDLHRLHERPGGLHWLAASCHSPDDLRRAEALGADFALLSPVLPTPSHPDAAPLGWTNFAQAVEAVNLPIYALGGMRPDLRETAWHHGAQGIAGIRGIVP